MRVRLYSLMLTLAVAAACCNPAFAGSYGTELPYASGTGARASGMGLAASSLPGTPTTLYFNPALLSLHERKSFEFFRTTLFDSEARYHSAAYVHPSLDWGTIGATILRLDVGGIEERDASNQLLSSDLENSQTRVLVGYAVDVLPSLAVGANFKLDRQSFAGFSGSSYGIDLGLLGTHELERFRLVDNVRGSIVVENLIEPSTKLDRDDVADPRRFVVGASADGRFDELTFATAVDLVSPRYSPFHARFGQEVGYRGMLSARFGFDGSTPTFGVGGAYRGIVVDYAFREEDLGSNHRISLTVAFGPSLADQAAARRERENIELQSRVRESLEAYEDRQRSSLLGQAEELFAEQAFEKSREKYEMVLLWDEGNEQARERLRQCDLEEAFALADAAMDEYNYAVALHHLKRAAAIAPEDPRTASRISECERRIAESENRTRLVGRLLTQAVDLYTEQDYPNALAALDEVLGLDPDNMMAQEFVQKCRAGLSGALRRLRDQALREERRGELEAALGTLRLAAETAGDRSAFQSDIERLQSLIAAARREAEKPDPKTRTESRRSVPVDTRVLQDKYVSGLRELEAGNFESAGRLLMHVWTLDPTYREVAQPLSRAYLLQGMRHYSAGDYDEAISLWQRILTIDPGHSKAKRYLRKANEERMRLSGGSP